MRAYNFILNLHACRTEQLWPEAWAVFEAPVEEGGPKWPSSGRMCEQVHSVRQTPAQIPNIGKVAKNSCNLPGYGTSDHQADTAGPMLFLTGVPLFGQRQSKYDLCWGLRAMQDLFMEV